jgi:hypothetical protein
MASVLSDAQIQSMIKEKKKVPKLRSGYKRKIVAGHYRVGVSAIGNSGERYYLYCNEAIDDPLEFSVGLGYEKRDINRLFLLQRYNSPDFPGHENPIEGEVITGFHIHTATQRYQIFGKRQEEKYAEATERYSNSDEALSCLLNDCGILENQTTLDIWGERDGY